MTLRWDKLRDFTTNDVLDMIYANGLHRYRNSAQESGCLFWTRFPQLRSETSVAADRDRGPRDGRGTANDSRLPCLDSCGEPPDAIAEVRGGVGSMRGDFGSGST